ncbi:MAG TPA: redoxin domain-containing protein [Acidisarcina sp.]
MFKTLRAFALVVLAASAVAGYAVRVGDSAPDFKGADTNGAVETLSQYRGKYVVLEWTNNGCPYTRKHYSSGNMQRLQHEWTGKGVIWLTILSSAPGHEGYMTAAQERSFLAKMGAAPTAAILDPTGAIGHEYEARTTPHMFVIDPASKLIYQGAIDDHESTDVSDIAVSKNYVSAALTAAMSGKPVLTPFTRAYGCSVKYAD